MLINPNSHKEQFLRNIIEKQNVDILFECFAGLLIRSKAVDKNNVHVTPFDNHRRSYKNDIILAQPEEVGEDEEEIRRFQPEHYFEETEGGLLCMYTSRSAILDYLPEDFYTAPDNKDEFWTEEGEKKTKDDIKAYRKIVREQVKSANRFFRPLEIEYNKVRIERELAELDQLENFDKTLESFWGDFKITNDKWRRFVRTLHLIPHIIGDEEKTKALIEYVLDTFITLSFDINESCEILEAQQKELNGNERLLGYNITIGNTVFDYLETCTLKICNLSEDQFYAFIDTTSDDSKLLNEIIKFYFPLNLEVIPDFEIKQIPKEPNSTEEAPIPILGYSSRLGE